MERQMTVIEVLEATVENLGMIPVPRALNKQIGIPIDQAIENIRLCLEAFNRDAEMKKAEDENKEDEDSNDDEE